MNIMYRTLRVDEVRAAAALIARGMLDNPVHIQALGADPADRQARVERLFRAVLPSIVATGSVLSAYDGARLVGLAGYVPPAHTRVPLSATLGLLARLLWEQGPRTFARMGEWQGVWRKHDLQEPHWHIGPVVVAPELWGRGIGSAMLEQLCLELDRSAGVGFLETDKSENVRLYERFGFVTVAKAEVLGAPNWFMRREPQAAHRHVAMPGDSRTRRVREVLPG